MNRAILLYGLTLELGVRSGGTLLIQLPNADGGPLDIYVPVKPHRKGWRLPRWMKSQLKAESISPEN